MITAMAPALHKVTISRDTGNPRNRNSSSDNPNATVMNTRDTTNTETTKSTNFGRGSPTAVTFGAGSSLVMFVSGTDFSSVDWKFC